jgi:3-hydroxyacyl-CoA dehydrogenase/enoyl-CoA hydratase/3-hydroxybutyryl-CoA epimerase
MSKFDDLPLPQGAPEPGACVRLERPRDGVALLYLEPPHRSLAVLDVPLMRDLDACLEELKADRNLRGLVITGRDPLSFAAGADVEAIEAVTDEQVAYRLARLGQELFEKLYRMSRSGGGRVRTVAAVGGPVPGGAFELSLACDRIVLADHPRSRIGLPETQLGILPGWGGCQRLPRRVGVPIALDAILSGRLYPARKAKKLGLVDRLAKPEYLVDVARRIALEQLPCARASRGAMGWLVDRNPLARALIARQAKAAVMQKTKGHYPAPLDALELVVAAPSTSLEEGLEREARGLARLAVSSVSKALVGLFGLSEEAKKLGKLDSGKSAPAVTRAGVVGAGVMGAEIASLAAGKGVAARLADLDQAQLDRAVREHRTWADKQRKRRRLAPHEARGAVDRLETTTEPPLGFDRCDLVVEAVAERLDVKRAVLGAVAERVSDDALLATNTSSLSVADIAEGLPHPERVVGLHFFNPVRRMPLVEIVRGPATSDEVVARAAKFALDLGKTPVVVADVAGFLVNRLLGPYLDEAVRLFEEGADPKAIDAAMVEFGMPMGPFELLDEVGLDIASHAGASLEAAYGKRMSTSRAMSGMVDAGRLGKKTGEGFYVWERGKGGRPRRGELSTKLPTALGARCAALAPNEVATRLVACLVNEAALCVSEGVVAGPRELDLATVFGMGFAPFRGGLLRHADTRGASAMLDDLHRARGAADVSGRGEAAARFDPAPLLEELARSGGRFHDLRGEGGAASRDSA